MPAVAPAIAAEPASDGERVDRRVDRAAAAALAVFPLLPAGPDHLGLAATWWPEAWLGAASALAVWLAFRHRALGITPHDAFWTTELRLLLRGYGAIAAVATGSALLGLAAEGGFLAAADAGLQGSVRRLLRPMDQAVDPLFPLRVWLILIAGPLAFAAASITLWCTGDADRRRRSALAGCCGGLGLVSAFAILQHRTQYNLLPLWVRANPEITRSHSTLEDPNTLGSFLVLGIGIALGLWAYGRRTHTAAERRWAAAVAVIAGAALLTTVSRAAWIALPAAAILMAAFGPDLHVGSEANARRVRRLSRALVLAGAVLALVWGAARLVLPASTRPKPSTQIEVMAQTLDPRIPLDEVLKGRLKMWDRALALAGTSPYVGVGLGRYPRLYSQADGLPPENAHNFFLQVLAEAGAAGLAALLLFLGCVALALARLRAGRAPALASAVSLGLLAFVLTWVTGHPLLTMSNQIWLGCVLAIVHRPVRPRGSDRGPALVS